MVALKFTRSLTSPLLNEVITVWHVGAKFPGPSVFLNQLPLISGCTGVKKPRSTFLFRKWAFFFSCRCCDLWPYSPHRVVRRTQIWKYQILASIPTYGSNQLAHLGQVTSPLSLNVLIYTGSRLSHVISKFPFLRPDLWRFYLTKEETSCSVIFHLLCGQTTCITVISAAEKHRASSSSRKDSVAWQSPKFQSWI